METKYVVIGVLAVLNAPLYYLAGKLIFGDLDSFLEALKYWFTPDMWSWFRGEGWADMMAEWKLGLFLAICGGLVYVEYLLTIKLLPGG